MTTNVIDAKTFAGLQDAAGAEFVVELVATFLEEAPQMLAELRQARAGAHDEQFRRSAHSLKSNCQTFGALGLGAMARELELRGLAADAAQDAAALDALDATYVKVAAALRELTHA